MSSQEYWKRRAAQRMYEAMLQADVTADEISSIYFKSSEYISDRAEEIFEKYRTRYNLSEQEARELLKQVHDKTSINSLAQALQNSTVENKTAVIRELESAAYKARMERFLELQNDLDMVMVSVYRQEKKISTDFYKKLAEDAYYQTIFDLQKRTGLGFSFSNVSEEQIDTVLNMNWSGKHYSGRIWYNTNALAEKLKEEMLVGIVTGKTYREMSEEIAAEFASGSSQARRLVRTEGNHTFGEINAAAYKEAGTEEYIYLATLDLRTCKACCRQLDNKVFQLKDRMVGVNYPPIHPWCRCATIAAVDKELLKKMKRSARDPETGEVIYVPASMNYSEWYDKYVRGNAKAELEEKKLARLGVDRKQHEKYRAIFGNKIPERLDDFQNLKYTKTDEWEKIKSEKQDRLNQMEYSEIGDLKGKLGNKEVRSWYKTKDEEIPSKIDQTKTLREQAEQAFTLRNANRTHVRELMKDTKAREDLEITHRNPTFEELLSHKMNNKGLNYEQALQDIIKTSAKTNKTVDKSLGLE